MTPFVTVASGVATTWGGVIFILQVDDCSSGEGVKSVTVISDNESSWAGGATLECEMNMAGGRVNGKSGIGASKRARHV